MATPVGPPVAKRVDQEAILAAANKLKLNLVKQEELGPYHFLLIFTK